MIKASYGGMDYTIKIKNILPDGFKATIKLETQDYMANYINEQLNDDKDKKS